MNKIDFIIIGAQKAGTTAAAYNLNKHPSISVFTGKTEYGQAEIEFFNQHWERGGKWYFDQLPKEKNKVIGEKTAELLHRTICHERIYQIQPSVKLIVLLRCPIQRAYSQWRMAVFNKKDEFRSFSEVISIELNMIKSNSYKHDFYSCKVSEYSNWREGYILKGFYHEQLENLFKYFPKEQVYVSISEKVIKNKAKEYNSMFSFLNVASYDGVFEERFIGKQVEKIDATTIDLLRKIYKEPNEQLFNLLGYKISEWN